MTGRLRVIAMIVAVVVVIGAVTGIAFASASYEPAPAEKGLYIDGKQVEDADPMLTLGKYEVSFDEYRYYYMSSKAYFESVLGADVWTTDVDHAYELALRKGVLQNLQQKYAWLEIAEELGVELDEEENQSIQDDLAAKKEEHGSDFEAWLAENFYADEAMYVRASEEVALTGKAQEEYRAQAEKELEDTDVFEGVATAKHILIMPDEEAEDQELAHDEALAFAEDLLRQINESDDPETTFDELMNEYSQDTGLAENPDGYTFGEGTMVQEFYDATLALEIGDISEPVESEHGFHIILRLPLDETYVEENEESLLSSAVNTRLTERQDAVIEEDLPLTEGKYYSDVRPDNMI